MAPFKANLWITARRRAMTMIVTNAGLRAETPPALVKPKAEAKPKGGGFYSRHSAASG